MSSESEPEQWPTDATAGLVEMRKALTRMLSDLEGEVSRQSEYLSLYAKSVEERESTVTVREQSVDDLEAKVARLQANHERHVKRSKQTEEGLRKNLKESRDELKSTNAVKLRYVEAYLMGQEDLAVSRNVYATLKQQSTNEIAELDAMVAKLQKQLDESQQETHLVRQTMEHKLRQEKDENTRLTRKTSQWKKRCKEMEGRMKAAEAAAESVVKALTQYNKTKAAASLDDAFFSQSSLSEERPTLEAKELETPPQREGPVRPEDDLPRKRRRLSFNKAAASNAKDGQSDSMDGAAVVALERVDGELVRHLTPGTSVVGRGERWGIDRMTVSRKHIILHIAEDGSVSATKGSANPFLIVRKEAPSTMARDAAPVPLQHGDILQLAPHPSCRFRFLHKASRGEYGPNGTQVGKEEGEEREEEAKPTDSENAGSKEATERRASSTLPVSTSLPLTTAPATPTAARTLPRSAHTVPATAAAVSAPTPSSSSSSSSSSSASASIPSTVAATPATSAAALPSTHSPYPRPAATAASSSPTPTAAPPPRAPLRASASLPPSPTRVAAAMQRSASVYTCAAAFVAPSHAVAVRGTEDVPLPERSQTHVPPALEEGEVAVEDDTAGDSSDDEEGAEEAPPQGSRPSRRTAVPDSTPSDATVQTLTFERDEGTLVEDDDGAVSGSEPCEDATLEDAALDRDSTSDHSRSWRKEGLVVGGHIDNKYASWSSSNLSEESLA